MAKKNPALGIIGGGQLGSLLASAAKKLNIYTVVLTDDNQAPAKHFCNEIITADYSDSTKVREFTNKVDVVTFEFENIPINILETIAQSKPVFPRPAINKIVQNRLLEKQFVNSLNIQTTLFEPIKNKLDLSSLKHFSPAILKTNTLGYDGKGQYVLNNQKDFDDLDISFDQDYILEKKIDLDKEISVIVTRYQDGTIISYEPIENVHKDQILNQSSIPANISKNLFEKAQDQAKIIAEKLDYVGTMCVEYFIDKKNNLLVNEIAPRVHNSGHLTINAFNISQFENHVRAVCNLEILPIKKVKNAKMLNILGLDIEKYRNKKFSNNEYFFDYLKKEPKEKRKMGHLTTLVD
mgnify:CR=1 FL=1